MSRFLENDLHFGNDCFLPIDSAYSYLVNEQAVYQLDKLYFYYKGFASQNDDDCIFCTFDEPPAPEQVYLDALSLLDDVNAKFWRDFASYPESFHTQLFTLTIGKVNGKYVFPSQMPDECILFNLPHNFYINLSNLYVNKFDLDELSNKYGIAKNSCFDGNYSNLSATEDETSAEVNVDIHNTCESAKNSIIEFIKLVLIKHPNIKTADICKNCFEEMHDLNSRDKKIINDLLTKAGIRKSKPGEHAITIEWKEKYPKAQWMRVFNKIN